MYVVAHSDSLPHLKLDFWIAIASDIKLDSKYVRSNAANIWPWFWQSRFAARVVWCFQYTSNTPRTDTANTPYSVMMIMDGNEMITDGKGNDDRWR